MAARTKKHRDLLTAIKQRDYIPNIEDSLPQRGAHFLNWAATNHPKEYVPYNFLVRAVMGYKRTPRMDAEEVTRYRGKMSRIRRILQDEHGRELTSSPGIGVRATDSDDDILRTELKRKMQRFKNAKAALEKTSSLINTARLTASPDKDWFQGDVSSLLKTLQSPAFNRKLLPPAEEDTEE